MGVRTERLRDSTRDRALVAEIWYPGADAHLGQDLNDDTRDRYELVPGFPAVVQDAVRGAGPRAGRFPLVAFSHGSGGHRRQSTFLTTHLASHGYVVAAVDHVGNTYRDTMRLAVAIRSGGKPPDPDRVVRELAVSRPADVESVMARLLAGEGGGVDPERLAMVGHSLGGWTALLVAKRDPRIGAIVLLAPGGGASPAATPSLRAALDFDWGRPVPSLYLVAARDSLTPLAGMHELLGRTRGPKRMIVLANADHWHFCDRVEQVHEMVRKMPPPGLTAELARAIPPVAELSPGAEANLAVRGLTLAHLDAVLKESAPAADFLDRDLEAALDEHGIAIAGRPG